MVFFEKYNQYLAALVILLIGVFSFLNFPAESAYHKGADEGNYYRQAKLLSTHGWAGFNNIANDFINTPNLHDTPHPLRLGSTLVSALFVHIHDAYSTLSFLSLFNFLLLLMGTYLFVKKYWGGTLALFTLILLAVSPIELALSRRALMDSFAMTTAAFSFFAFMQMIDKEGLRNSALFVLSFMLALLVKETAILLLPFYTLVLIYLKSSKKIHYEWLVLFLCVSLPVLLVALIDLSIYGLDRVITILTIIKQPSPYSALWGQGPWYRYLADFLILSPYAFLLAVAYLGTVIVSKQTDMRVLLIAMLTIYLLFAYSFLSKNIRYCLLLDVPIRFFAASMLVLIFHRFSQFRWLPFLGLGLLIFLDLYQFHFYFITNTIYDTISYNLLMANHMICCMRS
ncbi:MAG: glycosyltransferase family 39 protein [Legionella sp.]|jgi:hypothetical protein